MSSLTPIVLTPIKSFKMLLINRINIQFLKGLDLQMIVISLRMPDGHHFEVCIEILKALPKSCFRILCMISLLLLVYSFLY